MIAGTVKDLTAVVRTLADDLRATTGTIKVLIRLELDGDTDDGKFWDGDSWEATPADYPTATHTIGGVWVYQLPAAATAKTIADAPGRLHFVMSDNIATPGSATAESSDLEEEIRAMTDETILAAWTALKAQIVSDEPIRGSIEEAFQAILVEARGKATKQGRNYTKFKLDGTTVYVNFTLDDPASPSARTPS